MKPKILVTFIESGKGHIMSAQSIYESLVERYGDRYEIEKSYIMSADGNKKLMAVERFMTKQCQNTNKVQFFGKFIFPFIHFMGGQKLMRWVHKNVCSGSFKAILKAFKERKPDVIVSTHYYISLAAGEYKRQIDPNCIVVTYNPDNMLHPFWDTREGYFLVNSDRAYKQAMRRRFRPGHVARVPLSVRKEVERCNLSRAELRRKHGLPEDKFTVTLADGAYMYGRAKKYTKKLIKSGLPLTLLVITGYHEKNYRYFVRRMHKVPDNITLNLYKFTDVAYELYGASDVFITKGGPNAVLDSLYMDTPVMINYTPHMIEEETYKLFVKRFGCGVGAFTARRAVKLLRGYIADPSALKPYADGIAALKAGGNGADRIADFVAEKLDEKEKPSVADQSV